MEPNINFIKVKNIKYFNTARHKKKRIVPEDDLFTSEINISFWFNESSLISVPLGIFVLIPIPSPDPSTVPDSVTLPFSMTMLGTSTGALEIGFIPKTQNAFAWL